MRIVVCGSRDFAARWLLNYVLDELLEEYRFDILAHGDASGADRMAGEWADDNGIDVLKYRADWASNGRAAGPIRNRKMLNIARPSLVVAFATKPLSESRGTYDMVSLAEKSNLPVHLYSLC